jgi:hypothetical protein
MKNILLLIIIVSFSACGFWSGRRATNLSLPNKTSASVQLIPTKHKEISQLLVKELNINEVILATQLSECNLPKNQNIQGQARQLFVLFDNVDLIESSQLEGVINAVKTRALTTINKNSIQILSYTWSKNDCINDLIIWTKAKDDNFFKNPAFLKAIEDYLILISET